MAWGGYVLGRAQSRRPDSELVALRAGDLWRDRVRRGIAQGVLLVTFVLFCPTPGSFKGPRGRLKGPRDPFKGPRGLFQGPRGPLKGSRGPFKGGPDWAGPNLVLTEVTVKCAAPAFVLRGVTVSCPGVL